MDVIVTYQGPPGAEAWTRRRVSKKGSVVLYPDGLLNVCDEAGRTFDVDYEVKRVELFMDNGRLDDLDAPKPTP